MQFQSISHTCVCACVVGYENWQTGSKINMKMYYKGTKNQQDNFEEKTILVKEESLVLNIKSYKAIVTMWQWDKKEKPM